MTGARTALLVALVFGLPAAAAAAAAGSGPEAVWPPPQWMDLDVDPTPVAVGSRAMVTTANAWATQAGLDALERGGSAIDAAVAIQFVLNVVEPQSSGIGGGCFIVYLPPGADAPITIDGRETAPAAATPELFLEPSGEPIRYLPDRVTGGLAVGVPGTLAALAEAHARHGRLDWAELIEPAIELAERGFPVSRRLHETIRFERARLSRFPATRDALFEPDGSALRVGRRWRQPELAATFRRIARDGVDAFYRGEIAEDVAGCVAGAPVRPGLMTVADLAAYRAIRREPVRGRYRGVDVFGIGPPSSGGTTLIEILQILDGFDLGSAPLSVEAMHRMLEASRLAFADRNRYVGDPDFVDVPTSMLTDAGFAATRRAEIDPARAAEGVVGAADVGARESQETSHYSVYAPDGGILAVTTTLEQNFGSGMIVPGRGFFLNNELSDFDAVPVDAEGRALPNRVQAGKRPRSSMAPTLLVKDGRPFMAVGSPGGSRIIGITLMVILGVVDWQLDVQQAIDLPRAFNRGRDVSEAEILYFDAPSLEALYGRSGLVDSLEAMGHRLLRPKQGYRGVGGVHAIVVESGRVTGGADPRREGVALGY